MGLTKDQPEATAEVAMANGLGQEEDEEGAHVLTVSVALEAAAGGATC